MEHLHQFVGWLEKAHFQGSPFGSPFEQQVPPDSLAWAESALEFALSTRWSVALYTRMVPAQAILTALVFHRANVQIEDVYSANLTDDAFGRLTAVIGIMSRVKFDFQEGWPDLGRPMGSGTTCYLFIC